MIERFFDWFYGRLADAAQALGEAAVRALDTALMLKRIRNAVGMDVLTAYRDPGDRVLVVVMRCPACERSVTVPIDERSIEDTHTDHHVRLILRRLVEASDAHVCKLDVT